MSFKHPANHPSPVLLGVQASVTVLSKSQELLLWNWELLQVAKHLRKKDREEICKLPMYKNRVLPPGPRILELLLSSSFSLSCYTGNPM